MAQKYVIVHFVDTTNISNEFSASEWPLHVTLLANFYIVQLDKLKNELTAFAQQTKPFDITADGEALFGPQKNIPVSLIRPSRSIMRMHDSLLSIALGLDAALDEPDFTGSGFRPHASMQINSRLQDNQVVRVANFTLVDMYPNNDMSRRKTIETYSLT